MAPLAIIAAPFLQAKIKHAAQSEQRMTNGVLEEFPVVSKVVKFPEIERGVNNASP